MSNIAIAPLAQASPLSWRDVLVIHPAANVLPPINDADLAALAEDIKEHGQQQEVAIFQHSDGNISMLDGRSRLDAMEMIGLPIVKDGALDPDVVRTITVPGNVDPYAYVMSANVHRRHLSGEDKRRVIAELLKANPEQSNRQIAKQVKADDKTVGKIRHDLEAGAEIPHLTVVTGSDGKSYPVPDRNSLATSPEPEVVNDLDEDDGGDREDDHDLAGAEPEPEPVKTRAEIRAEKIAADLDCVRAFPGSADLVLEYLGELIEAQKAGRRLLKRRSQLPEDQVKAIETVVGIDLEPVRKILSQASKVEVPTEGVS